MDHYAEMQNQIESNKSKLEDIEDKSKQLDNKSNEVKNIVNSLKKAPLVKDKYILDEDDKDKIISYIDKVDKTNNEYKSMKELSVTLNNVYTDLKESRDKVKELEQNNEALELRNNNLKKENNNLKSKIRNLENELDNVKDLFAKFKKKIDSLVHFFIDKMWVNKQKRDKYYGIAYKLYGKNILEEDQMKSILNTKKECEKVDSEK